MLLSVMRTKPDFISEALQRPEKFDRANLHFEILRGDARSSFRLLREALTSRIPDALGCEGADLTLRAGRDSLSGIVFVPWSRGASRSLADRV